MGLKDRRPLARTCDHFLGPNPYLYAWAKGPPTGQPNEN